MNDQNTSLKALKEVLTQFVAERDWEQFHSPKNLSMSLAIEAAELMEHFQWITIDESRQIAADPEKKAAAAEELADVFSYTLAIANAMDIDLTETYLNKMEKNRQKYPADQFQGRWGHRDRVAKSDP